MSLFARLFIVFIILLVTFIIALFKEYMKDSLNNMETDWVDEFNTEENAKD